MYHGDNKLNNDEITEVYFGDDVFMLFKLNP